MENAKSTACKIDDVVDYVITRFGDEPKPLSVLKLQKLLFYVQAWRLALTGAPLFDGKFQAWVHGPVSRQVYDRFKESHSLYSWVSARDIRGGFNQDSLSGEQREHVDEILEAYGGYSGPQLEAMTHDEEPWIAARGDRLPHERCETEIDEGLMARYYAALLKNQH